MSRLTQKWRISNERIYISKDDFERFLIWHNISLDKIPFPIITEADIKAEAIDEFVELCDEAKICVTYYHVSMDAIRNIAKILKERNYE